MRSRTFVVVLLCFGFLACGESTSRTVEPRIRLTTPAGNALPATLAFDPAPVGGHSDRTIRIHADTAAALEIRDIAFEAEDGASAEVFAALDVDLPLHVPALQHRDVTLRFSPALVATYEATLVVRSSDPARGAVRVPVENTQPDICVNVDPAVQVNVSAPSPGDAYNDAMKKESALGGSGNVIGGGA